MMESECPTGDRGRDLPPRWVPRVDENAGDDLRNEEIDLIVDEDLPTPRAPTTGGSGSVLAAAMLAVGEIIEPEKTTVEVQQEAGDPNDGLDGIRLDFGDLPPLN